MRIKNWERFQHYKNRRPPWIKLYRELLDDPQYFALPEKAAKYLPLIWLIASDANGLLPAITPLSFRLRMTEKETNGLLSALSHWVDQDASNVLADCKQSATPEQEGEGEGEREKETPLPPKGGIAPKPSNSQEPTKNGDHPDPSPQHLIDLWNNTVHPNLPKVQILTGKRKIHICARLKEHPKKEFWAGLIERVNKSPMLRGENGNGWKCSFDWILNVNNMAKILEGNYDAKR